MIDIGHPELPIHLRLTQGEDVAAIYEIKRNEEVAKNQYRPSPRDVPETFIKVYLSDGSPFRAWSIVSGERVIGHIEGSPRTDRTVSLGFNLHPDFWGRGVMSRTLIALRNELYSYHNAQSIICDCFSDNERCRGLLKRLAFKPGRMGLAERINIWLVTGCTRRIIRHKHHKSQL